MTRPVGRPPGGTDGEHRTIMIRYLVSPSELEELTLAGLAQDPPVAPTIWAREAALSTARKTYKTRRK